MRTKLYNIRQEANIMQLMILLGHRDQPTYLCLSHTSPQWRMLSPTLLSNDPSTMWPNQHCRSTQSASTNEMPGRQISTLSECKALLKIHQMYTHHWQKCKTPFQVIYDKMYTDFIINTMNRFIIILTLILKIINSYHQAEMSIP
jgi:hypothetical protein